MAIPDWYDAALRASARVETCGVFFVLGCQKSGTTWVCRLLDEHPAVTCRGEGHITDVLAPLLERAVRVYNEQGKTTRPLTREDLFAGLRLLADQLLHRYLGDAGASTRMLGDKTPEAAVSMPLLNVLYPGARFIHVIRDGRDGAVSGWAHLRRQGQDAKFASFEDYAEYFAASHWKPYIMRARDAGRAAAGRYLEVRYETLLDTPHAEVRRMLELLSVDADERTVERCISGASFERLSGGRSRGEENAASHFRKGVAGDWVEHFSDEARRRFEAAAGDLLETLGYAEPPVSRSA